MPAPSQALNRLFLVWEALLGRHREARFGYLAAHPRAVVLRAGRLALTAAALICTAAVAGCASSGSSQPAASGSTPAASPSAPAAASSSNTPAVVAPSSPAAGTPACATSALQVKLGSSDGYA